jgi:hypothetical protein
MTHIPFCRYAARYIDPATPKPVPVRKLAMRIVMSSSGRDNLAAAAKLTHVRLLGSLREKVDPGHSALIVIDMQNDFCGHGGLVDKGGRDVSAVQAMARQLPSLIVDRFFGEVSTIEELCGI